MFKNCIVNGNEFPIDQIEFSLDDLLKKFIKDKDIKIAVAVNNRLIEKSEWKKKKISNGDVIEIVQPFLEDDLKKSDALEIDGKLFNSRLIMGTYYFLILTFLTNQLKYQNQK